MTVVIPTAPVLVYLKSYKTASTSFEIALLESVKSSFPSGLDEPGLAFHVSIDAEKYSLPVQKNSMFFRGVPRPRKAFLDNRVLRFAAKVSGFSFLKQHQSAKDVRRVLGGRIWKEACKVTTVRNPWDLAVSRYRWMSSGREGRSGVVNIPFANFIEGFTGNGIIRAGDQYYKIKTLRQHLYPFVYDKMTFCCDEYVRFETLETDAAALFEKFGLARPVFHKVKVSGSASRPPDAYRDYYDDYSRGLVLKAAERFIKDFGYEF